MTPAVSQDPSKQAVWEIKSTHPEKAESVDKALRQVIDPEIGLNILELGLIRNIVIKNDNKGAHITMIMTTPFCPYAPALLEMARSKVEETLKVETSIEMGMEMWDVEYMEEGTGADWGLF